MDISKCLDSKKRNSHDVEATLVLTTGGIELPLIDMAVFELLLLVLEMILPEIVLRLVDFKLLLTIEEDVEEIVDISIVLNLAK